MKKQLLLLLLPILFSSCISWEQTPPELLNKPFTYVTEYEDLDKAELFTRANLWVAETYNSAESVISFTDEESGVLKGNGLGITTMKGDIYPRKYSYNISIYVKDNKAKIEFSNTKGVSYYSGGSNVSGILIGYKAGYDAVKIDFDDTAESFHQGLLEGLKTDW